MSNKLKKNDIAKVLGMSRSTIRYYEQMGLIEPDIDDNNYRKYGIEEMKRLSQIDFLRSLDLSIETIEHILNDDTVDPMSILTQKKKDLRDLIKSYERNIRKIDKILNYSHTDQEHMRYEKLFIDDRCFYRVKSLNGELSDLIKENTYFFNTYQVNLDDWFINAVESELFFYHSPFEFTEYIQMKDVNCQRLSKEDMIVIQGGQYLCFELAFDDNNEIDWTEIAELIKQVVNSQEMELRDSEILFFNKDNLNFNFTNLRRLLSVQVPIQA